MVPTSEALSFGVMAGAPDAEPPSFIGMYERGATAIPVVFG